MPKDIRSYFCSTFKPQKPDSPNLQKLKINRKRKKNLRVLSDSDEEPVLKSPKNEKKKKVTEKKDNESSKYFEEIKEPLHKLFGNTPVKRKTAAPSRSKIATRSEIDSLVTGIDDDEDWESSFLGESSNFKEHDVPSKAMKKIKNEFTEEAEIEIKKSKRKLNTNIGHEKNGEDKIDGKRENKIKKTSSPQKTISSYLSPSKDSKKYNSLDVNVTKISPGKTDKQSFPKFDINKGSSPEKFQTQSEIKLITTNPVKEQNHIVDHDMSPSSSDDETEKYNKSAKIYVQKQDSNSSKVNKQKPFSKRTLIKDLPSTSVSISENKKTESAQKPSLQKLNDTYELWAEKYRPSELKQIIGQQGEKSNVKKLLVWLRNWFENRSKNKKISRPSPWAKDDNGAFFKAALLSGPPGVGKTTTAHLICKELNMDVVEFNASDTRSKKSLNQEISELLTSKSLSPYINGKGSTSHCHVLLMDEVDGMAGNEDRGGMQELITLIKNTKTPIVCMCNDRNHPKIRSLVNYCYDLRFNRPRVDQIKAAMLSICFKEKLKLKPETLTDIISSTNSDIRLVLNHLSMLAAKTEQSMNLSKKEIKLGAWDVTRKVFSSEDHKSMSIHDKCDLFFHDYSIAPLFVHENYLIAIPYSEKGKTKQGKMDLFAKVSSSLCYGDLVENAIRSQNAWSLLPTQAVFSSLIPGETLSGRVGGMINFPSWLGKNSKRNKIDRLCQEIQLHTRLKVSASKEAVCTDYCYSLRNGIALPLATLGSEAVETSLGFLHDYNLLREDIESLTELTSWPQTKDPFSSLDSKVKAAFTRAYNKRPVMTPFSISGPAGISKGRKGSSEGNELKVEGEDGTVSEASEQEDDDPLSDVMIKVKSKDKKDIRKKSLKQLNSNEARGRKKGKK